MAVEKLASGRIYVRTPYTRTAAEDYVSMFTKSRLSEFERAQKDARDETELKKLEYKAQLAAYQERIKSADRYRAKLADLKARTMNKEFDDATALEKLGAIQGEQYAGRVDAQARAATKQVPVVVGSTTTTTQTGSATTTGGGGGGGAGGRPKSPDLSPSATTQKQIDDEFAGLGTGPGTASREAQYDIVIGKLGTAGGITTTDPDDRRKALGQLTERLASDYEGGFIAMGEDPAVARREGRARAKARATTLNPANGALVDKYFADMDRIETETAGTGAPSEPRVTDRSGETKTVSEKTVRGFKTNPNLPDAAVATPANLGPATNRQDVIDAINKELGAIPEARALPTAPTMDPFTRGRDLYAQRFGPSVPMQPYNKRRMVDTVRGLPPQMQDELGAAFRKYLLEQGYDLDSQEGGTTEARRTPEKDAIVARVTDDAAADAAAAPAPQPAPGQRKIGDTYQFTAGGYTYEAELEPEFGGKTTYTAIAGPGVDRMMYPTIDPSDPERYAQFEANLAGDRAADLGAKKAELQALIGRRAADRSTVDALLADVPSSTPMPEMPPMAPPPAEVRRTLPQFTQPEQRAAPFVLPQVNTAEARKRALELAALGMKPEGELMQSTPSAPSTAMAAPKQGAKLDLKGPPRPPPPPPDDLLLAAASLTALTKNLVDDEKFRERVLKSKPGEFASKVYLANREANKTVGASQNTVVDEYMGNTKDMKTALAVVYALDALSKPIAPVKALTK